MAQNANRIPLENIFALNKPSSFWEPSQHIFYVTWSYFPIRWTIQLSQLELVANKYWRTLPFVTRSHNGSTKKCKCSGRWLLKLKGLGFIYRVQLFSDMTDLKTLLENFEKYRFLGTSSRNSDAIGLRWIVWESFYCCYSTSDSVDWTPEPLIQLNLPTYKWGVWMLKVTSQA